MGFTSWIACDTGKAIKIGTACCVLIPKEFGGGYIDECCYRGYTSFCGRDIFELIVDWNKDVLSDRFLEKPLKKDYTECYFYPVEERKAKAKEAYERAVRAYQSSCQKILDFQKGLSDVEMRKRYGKEWKRELGIEVAYSDEASTRLRYPIKIAKSPGVYEDYGPSAFDPMQGCD